MEHYSAIKINEILLFVAAWIGIEGIVQSEISQGKTNNHIISLIVEFKECKQIKLKQTQTQRTYGGCLPVWGGVGGGGGGLEDWVKKVKGWSQNSHRDKAQHKIHSKYYCNNYVWWQVGMGNTRGTLCVLYDCLTTMLLI